MEKLQIAETWVGSVLNTPVVAGIPAGEATELLMTHFFGDFAVGPDGSLMAMSAGIVWFLSWSLLAMRLDRAGRWKSALFCYAVGYELCWVWTIILYMAAGRLALFLVVLPVFGWTFSVVSALTALVFWKNGVRKVVFGLPGLLLNFAGKHGFLNYFCVDPLRNRTTPEQQYK